MMKKTNDRQCFQKNTVYLVWRHDKFYWIPFIHLHISSCLSIYLSKWECSSIVRWRVYRKNPITNVWQCVYVEYLTIQMLIHVWHSSERWQFFVQRNDAFLLWHLSKYSLPRWFFSFSTIIADDIIGMFWYQGDNEYQIAEKNNNIEKD